MEALIPLLALVAFAVLAMRYGADSRPAIQSHEQQLASSGLTWDPSSRSTEPSANASPSALVAAEGAAIGQMVGMHPETTPAAYATLNAIDLARDSGQPAFATDPDAAWLEMRARQLTDQHWSECAWLTGRIDRARLETVCHILDRERVARQFIDIGAHREQPSQIAS